MNQNPEIEKLNKKAKEYSKMLQGIHAEMSKVIVGQDAGDRKSHFSACNPRACFA